MGESMKVLCLVIAAVFVASCGGTTEANSEARPLTARNAGAATLPPGVIVLQRVNIPDPGVIAQTTALTALIPAGWTGRGGVVPMQGLCSEPFGVDWSAVSEDGLSSVSMFPTTVWQWSNSGVRSDCPAAAFSSVREYLVAHIQRAAPGARILDYRARPDLAKSAEDQARRRNRMTADAGLAGMSARADGGEILYAYSLNGTDMRGAAAATAIFYESQLPNPMGGDPLRNLTGATLGSFAATAPNGKLDFTLVEAVRRSVAPNPEWLKRLFALQNQLGQIAVQGTEERAAIIVAGGAVATRSNIAAFEAMANAGRNSGSSGDSNRSDGTDDRIQRESIEAIRGVETYHDPVEGGAVQLDATYDHAWRVTNQDAYILTKDPNFNPGQYGIEATQMGVVQ